MNRSHLSIFVNILKFIGLESNFRIFINNFEKNNVSEFKSTHETIKYSEDTDTYHYQNRLINIDFLIQRSHFSFIYNHASIENIPLRMDADQAVVVIEDMIKFVVFMKDSVDDGVNVKDHLLMQLMLKT